MNKESSFLATWLTPLIIITLITAFFSFFTFIIDYYLSQNSLHFTIFSQNADQILSALSSSNEVIAAVLAIIITVVAIIVELAATRYSSRIIDLFIADRINFSIISFFIILNIHSLWLYFFAGYGLNLSCSALLNTIGLTLGFIVIIPYFGYIFQFLKPESVINKIRQISIHQLSSLANSSNCSKSQIDNIKKQTMLAIEQINDIALNSIESSDTSLGIQCISALKEMVLYFLTIKHKLPDYFFQISPYEAQKTDFIALSESNRQKIITQRIILENKVFKHYNILFHRCVTQNRDVNYMIAMSLRFIAEKAVECEDPYTIHLCIKYFNTLLRNSFNSRDIRTPYNLFFQYKKLAVYLLSTTKAYYVKEIAKYFKYYGILFYQQKIGFILETAAHDFSDICVEAERLNSPLCDDLLTLFLTIDQPQESGEEDKSLRGVRKAQIKLGTFYLSINNQAKAQLIAKDMMDEPYSRIQAICQELDTIQEDFWEIIDRGSNFDFIPHEWRNYLTPFFDIFSQLYQSRNEKDHL